MAWTRPSRALAPLFFLGILAASTLAHGQVQGQDIDACIAASEDALALKKAERLVDERKALSQCATPSCPDAIKNSCQARLLDLNRAIPSVVFVVRDPRGRDLASVRLTVDGIPWGDRLDGSAITLDPGDHEFRFDVAGAPPVVEHLVLHEAEQERRETIVIGRVAEGGHDAGRTTALVVAAAGVAGLVVGAVFGVLSLTAHDAYEKDCGPSVGAPSGLCEAQAGPGEKDAATKGTVATALLLGGAAVTAAGATWYLLTPSAPRLRVGAGLHGIAVGAAF